MSEHKQPLLGHLIELRNRALYALLSVLIAFIALVYFSGSIYEFISEPLIKRLPHEATMIATDVASPFFAPLKLTLWVSVLIAAPVILYQCWQFIAPALYQHERRLIMPLMASSSLLFYAGILFAYYVVLPLVFGFFTTISLGGVELATDISSYLDFVLTLFLSFGIAFEVPIVIILLCWSGATDIHSLSEKRAYVLVGAFVLGMVLTPPDMISQTLLAIPMYILFELGLLMARFYVKPEVCDNVLS